MFEQTLPENTRQYLAILARSDCFPPKTYLSGGTAIALQLGHRISYDLDFFTQDIFNLEKVLQSLKNIPTFELDRQDEQTLIGHFSGCRFSLFYYQYPLISPTINFLDIRLAGLKDLAASKISAIASRGAKRDFVDLFYLLESREIGDLSQILIYYNQRFTNLAAQRFHILKSLSYFSDADKEADPMMLISNYSWDKIKSVLISETKKLA